MFFIENVEKRDNEESDKNSKYIYIVLICVVEFWEYIYILIKNEFRYFVLLFRESYFFIKNGKKFYTFVNWFV